ncbi:hypothetical protein A9Q99_12225 [Gammaproteobacteria bacterium 45_16_T64]|nr:hypothetical protein A9Q99_12225 [Gammaproteobacteria bacterium 45_16_T64]
MSCVRSLFALTVLSILLAACGGGGGGSGSYHIAISHTTPGVTCEATLITLTLHDDDDHSPVAVDADKVVALTYSPSVDAGNPTSVTVQDGESTAQFYLSQTTDIGQIDIDADNSSDGISDPDDHGSEDPYIEFRDTAFLFYADGNPVSTTAIGAQIAGLISSSNPSSQTLELRAIETDTNTKACTSAITGTETVQIAYECKNPTSCSSTNRLSFSSAVDTETITRNNDGATLSYTDVNMSFDSDGIAGFTVNYSDAGQIKLYAQKVVASASPNPGYTLEGSSNNFVVRPFGFDIDFSDLRSADWLDNSALDGTASNLTYATGASGTAYLKAEEGFLGTLSAVVWQSADDSPIDGIPDTNANLTDNVVAENFGQETSASSITFSHSLIAPTIGDGGVSGTFTASAVTVGGGSSSFSSGVATSTMNWNEVGVIDITGSLSDYLSDTSADITGTANDVGRFYPDHFVLTSSVGGYGNACATGTAFSYIGQSFGYASSSEPSVTVIPKRSGNDSSATINNYLGDFKKLTTGSIVMDTALTSANAGVDLSNLPVTATYSAPTLSDGGSGSESNTILTFNSADTYTYTRTTNALVAPFSVALSLEVNSLTDSDGVKAEDGSDVDISASAPFTFTPTSTGTLQRFGRLRLENAFGPETAALNVPINVEYYTGSDFIRNEDDGCLVLANTNLDLEVTDDDSAPNDSFNYTAGIITNITIDSGTTDGSIGNSPFSSGTANFNFSAPGADATAAIEIQTTDTSAMSWLLYNWDGVDQGSDLDFLDDNPSSTAIFGRYRGHDKILFWREESN